MITPQQSAIARLENIRGFDRQLVKEASLFMISSNLSAVGLLFFALSLSEKYNHLFSPEAQVGSGVIFFGGLAVGLIEAARMLKIQRETKDAHLSTPNGGNMAEIIRPLTEPLLPDEKRLLTATEAPMAKLLPLLPSGQPDPGPGDLEVPQPDESLALAGPRIQALEFILESLLDRRIISASPLSCVDRTEVLKQLTRVLAGLPTSFGSSLTGPEAYVLAMITDIGAMTEKAPETMIAYLEFFAADIESYVLNNKNKPRGKAMADDLMTAAVRGEIFTGVAVAPPIEEWKRAKELTDEEAEKVVLTEHQVIDFAKSMVALGNNRSPEVREAFLKIVPGLKNLLQKEKERLERLNQINVEPNIELAVISTVLAILDISIEKLVDKGTIDMLNQLFGNRLSGKSRIAPRDLMDEFKNTGLGSWSIEGDRIIVVARDINLADVLACAVVICYPHIPRIEICIKKDINEDNKKDRKIVDQSAVTPTGVFYFQRLIRNNKQYVGELIKEQSAKAESMSPLPVPALLAEVPV